MNHKLLLVLQPMKPCLDEFCFDPDANKCVKINSIIDLYLFSTKYSNLFHLKAIP